MPSLPSRAPDKKSETEEEEEEEEAAAAFLVFSLARYRVPTGKGIVGTSYRALEFAEYSPGGSESSDQLKIRR